MPSMCVQNLSIERQLNSCALLAHLHIDPELPQMLPPAADLRHPVDAIPAKHLHASLNKIKHPVNIVRWTPEGRRLLTGSSSGEFTLWNGMGFNFETIMQVRTVILIPPAWWFMLTTVSRHMTRQSGRHPIHTATTGCSQPTKTAW